MFTADTNWGPSALAETCLHNFLSYPIHLGFYVAYTGGGNMTQSAKIKYFTQITKEQASDMQPNFRPQNASTFSKFLF